MGLFRQQLKRSFQKIYPYPEGELLQKYRACYNQRPAGRRSACLMPIFWRRRRRGRCEPLRAFPAMLAVSYNICVTDRNMQELIE